MNWNNKIYKFLFPKFKVTGKNVWKIYSKKNLFRMSQFK